MTTILGLSGSLRKASFNAGLLRAAAELAPPSTTVVIGSIHDVPLYNADDEAAHGIPPAVQALKASLQAADGLLLVTPEYNNGIPGVFKNAIDWMSRPASDIPLHFGGKPVALLGASPGGFGTVRRRTTGCRCCARLGRVTGRPDACSSRAPERCSTARAT